MTAAPDLPPVEDVVRALSDYIGSIKSEGDPFKVRAAAVELTRAVDHAPSLTRLNGTVRALSLGIRGVVVEFEWKDRLAATPWHRRWREARNEKAWREQRFNERQAQAEAEVAAVVRRARAAARPVLDKTSSRIEEH